ncbi:hypothetical protein BY996DRAFT_6412310 [Phakopsora pachyrhizi]|nr:hypothetical protein BY996DRAFT_6412310 [Phakopsora pachyrhizi]
MSFETSTTCMAKLLRWGNLEDFCREVLKARLGLGKSSLEVAAVKPRARCFVELLFAAQLVTQVLFYCAAAAAAHTPLCKIYVKGFQLHRTMGSTLVMKKV